MIARLKYAFQCAFEGFSKGWVVYAQRARKAAIEAARAERTAKRHAMALKAREQGDWRDQVEAICQQHEVTLDEVLGPRRTRHIVAARHNVMVALRARGWSTTRIGQIMDRDHSTVVHALQKAKHHAGSA